MKMQVAVAREIAQKALRAAGEKNLKKRIAGFSNLAIIRDVPNVHAADKEVLGFYIPRTLAKRVRLEAKRRGLTLTAFIEEVLLHATRHVELTPEDYEAIAQATRSAAHSKGKTRSGRKGESSGAR